MVLGRMQSCKITKYPKHLKFPMLFTCCVAFYLLPLVYILVTRLVTLRTYSFFHICIRSRVISLSSMILYIWLMEPKI